MTAGRGRSDAAGSRTASVSVPSYTPKPLSGAGGLVVNDVHSQLNETTVHHIERPRSLAAVQAIVREAQADGRVLSVAGGRHAMGGQQFATGGTLIDMNDVAQVHAFDRVAGEIEVGAGIQWPELHQYLVASQEGETESWGFIQKQTGADRLAIGGALSANIHGRGLAHPPFVNDVQAFTLVGPDAIARRCSRTENPTLFRAAIGGYGLFGVVTSVRLRLTRRRVVQRIVEVIDAAELPRMFERRIAEGFTYGDFQFATDLDGDGLRRGVFSCYRPVADVMVPSSRQASLRPDDWAELLCLAHLDRSRAFEEYARYYLRTSGQHYWSDSHQMSTYVPDYHHLHAGRLGEYANGGEMITEIYVPRDKLLSFLAEARAGLKATGAELIYGTIRLIERDTETMLAWAREPFACIIFNLHVQHDQPGIARAKRAFRSLI